MIFAINTYHNRCIFVIAVEAQLMSATKGGKKLAAKSPKGGKTVLAPMTPDDSEDDDDDDEDDDDDSDDDDIDAADMIDFEAAEGEEDSDDDDDDDDDDEDDAEILGLSPPCFCTINQIIRFLYCA